MFVLTRKQENKIVRSRNFRLFLNLLENKI